MGPLPLCECSLSVGNLVFSNLLANKKRKKKTNLETVAKLGVSKWAPEACLDRVGIYWRKVVRVTSFTIAGCKLLGMIRYIWERKTKT